MQEMDNAHLSTWLHCLTSSSTLEHARDPRDMDILAGWLDLPYSYWGVELKSRSRSAGEEFIGSFYCFLLDVILQEDQSPNLYSN